MLTFQVPIKTNPGDVVRVGRFPASISNGKVEIRGRLGQSLMITARDAQGHLALQKVAIEADGPVPAEIDLSK